VKDDLEKRMENFFRQATDFQNGTRKKYPDMLLVPMYVPELPDPDGGNVHKPLPEKEREELRELRRLRQQYVDNWMQSQRRLLFITLGLDPNEVNSATIWEAAFERLAARHVKGFQITEIPPKRKKGRGAPLIRDDAFQAIVLAGVNEARRRIAKTEKKAVDKVSIPAAIKSMDRRFRNLLKDRHGKPLKASYIEKMFSQANKRLKPQTRPEGLVPLTELGKLYKNSKPDLPD